MCAGARVAGRGCRAGAVEQCDQKQLMFESSRVCRNEDSIREDEAYGASRDSAMEVQLVVVLGIVGCCLACVYP